MNIAAEIKRCIEVVKKQGLTVETRPPPTVCFDTLKRREAARRYVSKIRNSPRSHMGHKQSAQDADARNLHGLHDRRGTLSK